MSLLLLFLGELLIVAPVVTPVVAAVAASAVAACFATSSAAAAAAFLSAAAAAFPASTWAELLPWIPSSPPQSIRQDHWVPSLVFPPLADLVVIEPVMSDS